MESDFEKDILSFNDDLNNLDIKIKPNYYIHMAIIMAQKTLMISVLKSNINEGIIGYNVLIEHIEMICKAAEFISKEYDTKIKEFNKTLKESSETIRLAKLSNFKLKVLMSEVFNRSPSEAPLSDKQEL